MSQIEMLGGAQALPFPDGHYDEWRKVAMVTVFRLYEARGISFSRENLREFHEAFEEAVLKVSENA